MGGELGGLLGRRLAGVERGLGADGEDDLIGAIDLETDGLEEEAVRAVRGAGGEGEGDAR